MKYLRTELLKLNKCRESLVGYVFLLIVTSTLITGFKLNADFDVSCLDIVFIVLGNISRYIMLQLVMILMVSLLVAREFSHKTYRYIMVRPVSPAVLLIGKYIALWIYAGQLLLFVAAVSGLAGIILFGAGVLHGDNQVVLDRVLTRFIYFFAGTWFNQIFIIALGVFFSVIHKNQITTVIVTFFFLFVLFYCTRFVSDEFLYYTPLAYYTLKPFLYGLHIEAGRIFTGFAVTFLYSLVFAFPAYFILKKEQASI